MVSVIVPVLNEVAIIDQALRRLLQQTGDFEVIVVDGGSCDGTRETVQPLPVNLYSSPPGLSRQINLGATQAHGTALVLLHADVQLPPDGMAHIETALADPHVVGGGFVPAFDGPVPDDAYAMLTLVERAWQLRTRVFHWFVGDTAPFIRTEAFWCCGGYPRACFAGDWDFAARLQRLGRLAVMSGPVRVGSRRHVMNGVLKTLLVTGSVELMYHLGADREFLRQWYRRWLPREREVHSAAIASPKTGGTIRAQP